MKDVQHKHCCSGLSSLRKEIVDDEFQYGDGPEAVQLRARIPVWICPDCDEGFTDDEAESIRHNVVCKHLGRLTPDDILMLRKNHGLSQADFATLTGLGVASIKRWELGHQIQNAAADKLLRLIQNNDAYRMLVGMGESVNVPRPKFRTSLPKSAFEEAESFVLQACVT